MKILAVGHEPADGPDRADQADIGPHRLLRNHIGDQKCGCDGWLDGIAELFQGAMIGPSRRSWWSVSSQAWEPSLQTSICQDGRMRWRRRRSGASSGANGVMPAKLMLANKSSVSGAE